MICISYQFIAPYVSGHAVTNADVAFSSTHRFEKYNYTAPASCDFCNGLVWGPRTGVRCADCGYNCHEKCRENASKTCAAKYKGVARDPTSENLQKLPIDFDINHGDPHHKDPYRPSGDENSQIIHQGYLYKQVIIFTRIFRTKLAFLLAIKTAFASHD